MKQISHAQIFRGDDSARAIASFMNYALQGGDLVSVTQSQCMDGRMVIITVIVVVQPKG